MTDTMTEQQQFDAWREEIKPTAQAKKREWGVRERDLDLRLATMKPYEGSPLPLDKQRLVIDAVRSRITEGWAFFGLPGVGKTTLANGLFHQAVMCRLLDEKERGWYLPASLWRMTARGICQQAQDRLIHANDSAENFCYDPTEMARTQRRIISPERIERARNAGLTPHLFIEEWDKIGNVTDTRRDTLFDILDCMYRVEGQLVVTSNLTWDEFCATFGQTSWRLNKICNICRIEDVNKPEIIAKEP
jgi:hypothetical protein